MAVIRSIFMLLCFLSVGCTEKVSGVPESSGTSKLYLAIECENPKKTNLKVSEFFPHDVEAVPCEDVRKKKIYFSDDQLKIKLLKKDISIVQFNCLNPDEHSEFLEKYRGKSVVLVYDGTLLHSFIANGASRDAKCGELIISPNEDAVNMCLALADARGEPLESCTVACSEQKSKICLNN